MSDHKYPSTEKQLARDIPDRTDRFSLLWPPGTLNGSICTGSKLSSAAWRDLGLSQITLAFTPDEEQQKEVARVLADLCQDPAVIQYRQDVLTDLLENPRLTGRLQALFPAIDALGRYAYRAVNDTNVLSEVTWRMGELQSIADCILGLGQVFQEIGDCLTSQGFQILRETVMKTQQDPAFQTLVRELPELLSKLRTSASVTIGVNLDQFLRPVEATLLSVNESRFTSPQSMLNRLFGKKDGMEGIAPLHSVPRREVDGPYALPVSSELGWAVDPMMVPLFSDLAKVIEATTRPVAKQLKQYTEIRSRMFVGLRQDLIFYLGALRFIQRLQSHGLPVCRPTLAPVEERICMVENAYNVNLALRLGAAAIDQNLAGRITLNDISVGPQGRILIITGPNQGGKTTFMQGVGLVQVLAQLGLFVPGARARISPVDAVCTHFPLEEKPEAETGRFGEETKRLSEIFRQVTRFSLVLLNESLSSTSAGESLYLAQDVVRIFRRLGARALYSTHMHELADSVDEINITTPGDSLVVSLVSSPVEQEQPTTGDIRRSYKIEVRPPLGRSYARELAARYGISYEQLEKVLSERGVLQDTED